MKSRTPNTTSPHWHHCNPWASRLIYVRLEDLAEALAGGVIRQGFHGQDVEATAEFHLAHWRHAGELLDAYVLVQPHGHHSVGVRYGPEPHEYLSPYNSNPTAVDNLINSNA